MRWLSRVRDHASSRLGNESGVTIIFIAVVLLGLLAMTAFVVDFGRVWQERRELQTGATAAAFAVAEDCARDIVCDDPSAVLTAKIYADANATDGVAAIHGIALDPTSQTVEVVTATEESDGGGSMDMLFARIVGFDTITVGASAIVEWGTPINAATVPLIFSECEWMRDEEGWPGWVGYASGLPDSGEDLSLYTEVILDFHDPLSGGTDCTVHPGLDLPGGWGWLDTAIGCSTDLTVGWNDDVTKPGNSTPLACDAADFQDILGQPVLVPYYDELQGSGTGGDFHVPSFGAFVVTGYRFAPYSGFQPPYRMAPPCGPPTTCMSGYFVDHVANDGTGGPLGGPDRGVTVIQLIG